MDAQPLLPTLERHWPALIPGPVFVCFELRGPPGHKARHRSRLVIPKEAWVHSQSMSYIPKFNIKKLFIQQYPDPGTEAGEKVLAEAAALFMRGKLPTDKPVAMLIHIYKEVPKSWPKKDQQAALDGNIRPTSKPDWDNFGKFVSDALNKIVYLDDSQVVDARCIKLYDEHPALRIEVREMVEPS